MRNKHRPRDPDATYIPIDTGTGVVIYGKAERTADHPCCDGDLNPYTGEPWDAPPPGQPSPAIRSDAPDISPFREDDR